MAMAQVDACHVVHSIIYHIAHSNVGDSLCEHRVSNYIICHTAQAVACQYICIMYTHTNTHTQIHTHTHTHTHTYNLHTSSHPSRRGLHSSPHPKTSFDPPRPAGGIERHARQRCLCVCVSVCLLLTSAHMNTHTLRVFEPCEAHAHARKDEQRKRHCQRENTDGRPTCPMDARSNV